MSLCCPRLPWGPVLCQEVASCPEFSGGSGPPQPHSPQLAWPPQGCEVRGTSCLPSQAVHLTQGCHRGTEDPAIGLGEPTSGYRGCRWSKLGLVPCGPVERARPYLCACTPQAQQASFLP